MLGNKRFYSKKRSSITIGEIAEITGSKLINPAFKKIKITGVNSLINAQSEDISFFAKKKYAKTDKSSDLEKTKARALFVKEDIKDLEVLKDKILLLHPIPNAAFAKMISEFYKLEDYKYGISSKASVSKKAKFKKKKKVYIGPFAVISEGAEIGENVIIKNGAVIGKGVKIGDNTVIGENSVINYAEIGNNVVIYACAAIGNSGFGNIINPKGHIKLPHIGTVIIGDNVEIGANSCVDRGYLGDTIIGAGTLIDNQVQIGHNVKIGKNCIIAAQVGIGGSTELSDLVIMGGKVGIYDNVKVGSGTIIGAAAIVTKDFKPNTGILRGNPAVPEKEYLKEKATLRLLAKKKNKS